VKRGRDPLKCTGGNEGVNYQKLKDACGDDEADFAYSSEVVRRLQRVLGDQLSMTESVALMEILRVFTFRYQDGFIINDIHDSVKIWDFLMQRQLLRRFGMILSWIGSGLRHIAGLSIHHRQNTKM
jgi:hypothetical protein